MQPIPVGRTNWTHLSPSTWPFTDLTEYRILHFIEKMGDLWFVGWQ